MNKKLILDKQIHKDEFRLRLLLTDYCNVNCSYCLNDFQERGTFHNIHPKIIHKTISEYMRLCNKFELESIVCISGGEPTLHPEFNTIVNNLKYYKIDKLQINTNGTSNVDFKYFNSIRVHIDPNIPIKITLDPNQHVLIYVIKDTDTPHTIQSFLKQYKDYHIKTFVDFNSSKDFKENCYPYILQVLSNKFNIDGRFTGIQENRGRACYGCDLECVTLKGFWVNACNQGGFCPQRLHKYKPLNITENIYNHLEMAYYNHIPIN